MESGVDGDHVTEPKPDFPSANVKAFTRAKEILTTSIGPEGMQKLLTNERTEDETETGYVVTSDGATLLDSLPTQHPVSPVLERLAGPERPGDTGVEGQDVPDGVKSAVALATALLERGCTAVDEGWPPRRVVDGYRRAHRHAVEAIHDVVREPTSFDSPERVHVDAARTAATSGAPLPPDAAEAAAEVARHVEDVDHYSFRVHTNRGGEPGTGRLVHGAVLPRTDRVHPDMPATVEDAGVLVVEGHEAGGLGDPEPSEDVVYSPDTPDEAGELAARWREDKRSTVEHLVELDVGVVATRLGVDEEYARRLADHGVLAVDTLTALDVERLRLATGASPLAAPGEAREEDLGYSGAVSVEAGDRYSGRWKHRRTTFFDGCRQPRSMAYVVHGAADYFAGDARRDLLKAAQAASRARGGVVPGAGAVHVEAAASVRETANDPVEHLYADAVESLAVAVAENQGVDPLDAVTEARAARGAGEAAGFVGGDVIDAFEAGVVDPLHTVEEVYVKAFDVARLVLNVDDAVDASFERERSDPDDVVYDDVADRHRD